MASAEATKVIEIAEVTLRMSHEEARTLWAVMMKVGGSPADSPRKHADAIRYAVAGAIGLGAVYDTEEVPEGRLARTGVVTFRDYA